MPFLRRIADIVVASSLESEIYADVNDAHTHSSRALKGAALPVSRGVGVFLVLLAAFSWGMYGGIRKHFAPRAHDISFVVVQQISQFIFTLIVVLPQWTTIQTDYSLDKFLYVFFAGISTLVAEFLYLAATRHLSSTAAMACQHLPSDCFVSIVIDQCVQSYGVKLKYLVVASTLYLIGEGFFILVDYTYDLEAEAAEAIEDENENGINEKSKLTGAESQDDHDSCEVDAVVVTKARRARSLSHAHGHGNGNDGGNTTDGEDVRSVDRITVRNLLSKSHDEHDSTGVRRRDRKDSHASIKKDKEHGHSFHDSYHTRPEGGSTLVPLSSDDMKPKTPYYVCFWITVALLGGCTLGLFTILSSIGMTGDGAIWDPSAALLVLQLGQTLGLPVVIFLFGVWDPLDMMPASERVVSFYSLFNMTKEETIVALTVGCFIAGGYAAFYYGTVAVPFAVANGLLASETLVAFVFSAFVWNEYKGTEFFSPVFTYLLLGCVFYIYAVVVLSVLSF